MLEVVVMFPLFLSHFLGFWGFSHWLGARLGVRV